MNRPIKNLIILSLTLAVVISGGWYWYGSAKEARAAVNIPQTANRIPDIVSAMGEVANINLSSFDSLDQISSLFDVICSDNATMGQMSDWLDAFGQMGGGVQDLLDGNFRNLGDVVTGLGQITDLGGATDILGSLGNLGATADNILGGGLNFNNASDLISSLSQMTNSGPFSNVLDIFKGQGGSYEDLILYATQNGTDIGTIVERGVITMTDLEPLAGQGPALLGGSGSSGVGKQIGQTSQEAQQSLNQDRKQDEKECKAQSGGFFRNTGFNEDFNFTDLAQAGNNADLLRNLGASDLVDAFGGGLGGSYVPVQEQDGDLLDLTEDTNELTSEIKDLQVQICMHLKTIKRVQLNFEDKEFVGDVKAREEAAERLQESQKQTLQLANEGRTRADGTDGASYATDVEELVKERVQAAAKITTTQVGNSGSAFAPELKAYLTAESERSSIDGQLASTLSREQYKELTDRSKVTELDHDSLWSFILKAAEPQNRPDGAMMIAREAWMVAQAKAEDFAIAELVANNGFASNRECVEEDDDGNCISWKVKSPGSVIGRAVEEATQLDNQLTLAADEASDLSGVEEPGISEAENLEQNNDSSGGPGGGGGGPVGGGGQAPGGQGDNDDFDLDGILNMFDFDIDDDGTDNDNDRDNFTIPDFGFPIDWGNLGGNRAPSLTFKLTGPTLEQIYEGRPNVGTISWKAQNADKCVARNNWLSSSLIPNRVESVKTANQTLETSGSLITYLPLTFDLRLERTRGNQTVIIPFATTTSAALTQQVTSITLNNSEVAVGDRFSLVAKVGLSDEAKVTIETNVASAGAVNSLLGSALTSLSSSSAAGQEFAKYRITFTTNESGTAFITITADPIYSIRCTGNGRNTDKTVTVSRGS